MPDFGYCRVSSKDQNLDRQIDAMKKAGIPSDSIICEKESGRDMDRPIWLLLKKRMKAGDTLTIMSIDRLGRNYDEILRTWRELTERGVGIVVLDMPILNTAKDRDLTGRLISDIVLQLLSYVAETERAFIRKRQAEGIAAAKARGVRFGAQPIERPPGWDTFCRRYAAGAITGRAAAMRLGVSHTTFYRWYREYTKEGNIIEQAPAAPCSEQGEAEAGQEEPGRGSAV